MLCRLPRFVKKYERTTPRRAHASFSGKGDAGMTTCWLTSVRVGFSVHNLIVSIRIRQSSSHHRAAIHRRRFPHVATDRPLPSHKSPHSLCSCELRCDVFLGATKFFSSLLFRNEINLLIGESIVRKTSEVPTERYPSDNSTRACYVAQ